MSRYLRVPAVTFSVKSPRLESVFWRVQIGPLDSHFGFLAKNDGNHGEIMANIVWVVIYACQQSFWAQDRRDWREFFWRVQIGPLEGHFGFLVKNDGNDGKSMANIVRVVIYACPRSFWAGDRCDWIEFFDGSKLAPWRAILGFWSKTMEIMANSWLIFYKSWSTRARGHFEPKIAAIGENFFVWSKLAFCRTILGFWAKTMEIMAKSWLILYESWSTRARRHFEPQIVAIGGVFWRVQIGPLEGHFGFLAKNDGNHCEIMARIVWVVICACPRSFWAQNRRDWRVFSDGFKLAPWRAILGFWPKTMEIIAKSWLILYESVSTRARNHF